MSNHITDREIKLAAAALGRKGGKATSAAKTEAARENGAKGGRPLRWINDGPFWMLRALITRDDGTVFPGRVAIEFDAGRILDRFGDVVAVHPASATAGWGDLSGDDMIEIAGAVTHRAWFEEMQAKHA